MTVTQLPVSEDTLGCKVMNKDQHTPTIDPGFLYFVKNRTGNIKITTRVDLRKKSLQLLAFRKYDSRRAARLAERLFHDDFAQDHIEGKWFRPSSSILEVIALCKCNPEDPMF